MLDLLLPRRCAICRSAGTALCSTCATSLPAAPDLGPPPGFERAWSLLRYEGPTRELVAALKFHNHRDAIGLLGATMAELVDVGIDTVTWAPTSRARRRGRGYDQAELLARAVARTLGVPCRALLHRTSVHEQAGRGRAERLDGPEFAVVSPARRRRIDRTERSAPRTLIVDDVRTTGATLCAAADALHLHGAKPLCALTLAVRL